MSYNLVKSFLESDTEGLSIEELGGLPPNTTPDANGRVKISDFVQYKVTGAISLTYKCVFQCLYCLLFLLNIVFQHRQKQADEFKRRVNESAKVSAISFVDRNGLEERLSLRSKTQKKGLPRESLFLGGLYTPGPSPPPLLLYHSVLISL